MADQNHNGQPASPRSADTRSPTGETKIFYYIDDEKTPYVLKMAKPADSIKLLEFKTALNMPKYKYFFETVDADFGRKVKEELRDDEALLPTDDNGRIVCWVRRSLLHCTNSHTKSLQLVTAESSSHSDGSGARRQQLPKTSVMTSHLKYTTAMAQFDNSGETFCFRYTCCKCAQQQSIIALLQAVCWPYRHL